MTYRYVLLRAVILSTHLALLAGTVQAAMVIQRGGESYVAWEAEDFHTNVTNSTNPWQVITDANASNGVTLTPNGTNHTAPGGGVATYQLRFGGEGTYRLYFRMSSVDGGSDSMFRPTDFGVAPTDPPSPHLSITGGVYEWYNDSASPTRYLVETTDLGTTLTLSVGSREAVFRVDRFVLSTDTGLSDAELDALLNWDTYNHFTGTVDSDWSAAGNWEFGIAPRATTVAYIGDGKTAQLAQSATTGQLHIGHTDSTLPGDGTLSIVDGGSLNVVGDAALGTGTTDRTGAISMTGGSLHVGGSVAGGVGTSTVHVDGGTMTVGDSLTVDSLRVGYEARTASVTVGTGGVGDVEVRGGNLLIGRRTINSATNTIGMLDASAAASFTADVDNLIIGSLTHDSGASDVTGTLKLAANSTIAADMIRLGYISGGNVRTITGNLELGAQTTIDTETFIVGDHKGTGNVDFASSGTLNLSSTSGEKTTLRIGDNSDSNTSSTATGTMDLSGGVLVADLGQLVLGDYASDVASTTGGGSGSAIGTLILSDSALNNVQVDSVLLGNYARNGGSGSGTTKTGSGTITMGGGTFAVAGSMVEGVNYGAANGATVASTLNLNGGTMTIGGDLSIRTINFNDGTLAARSIGAGGAGTMNWTGGTLQVDTFGTVANPFNLVQDGGTLAPGNSPGMTTVYGDYTMNAGTLAIEINGLDQGDQGLAGDAGDGVGYDFVMVHGDASLTGVLDVALLDDFVPELGTYFDVLQTTGTLAIDGLTLNSNWPTSEFGWWDFGTAPAGDGFALRLSAVPEPTSALLAILACSGLLGCVRPRRRRHLG